MSTIKESAQGIRIAGKAMRMVGQPHPEYAKVLKAGNCFYSLKDANNPEVLMVPVGCVGIIHDDADNQISVVRNDCQAARRAIRKANN